MRKHESAAFHQDMVQQQPYAIVHSKDSIWQALAFVDQLPMLAARACRQPSTQEPMQHPVAFFRTCFSNL
jgi:hypothetical protein